MARGKHKSRATNQRSIHNESLLGQLKSELTMESEALEEASATLEQIARFQSDLTAAKTALLDDVAPAAERLREERDFLRTVFADARSHHARIQETWARYGVALIDSAPGATHLERVESMQSMMGFDGYMDTETHLKVKNRSIETVTRLQRARGERTNVAEGSTPTQRHVKRLEKMLDLEVLGYATIRPSYRQSLLDQGLVFRDEDGFHQVQEPQDLTEQQAMVRTDALDSAERIWDSHASDLDADRVYAWGAGNIISVNGVHGEARLALGAAAEANDSRTRVPAGITTGVQLPLSSTPATSRNALAQQSAESALAAWRSVFESRRLVAESLGLPSHPFAPLAHHPHPAQGLALQNTYALSAFSGWLHQGTASADAHAAIGLTAAATYWLPAGQTASFAESEPLNEADRAEMVLPFPQVFLAFAEPLVLEPAADVTGQTEQLWRMLSEITHDLFRADDTLGNGIDKCFRSTGHNQSMLPTIDRMLSELGAHIEGVLLLADSLGRPEDRFAWCLTFPGAYGTTLGRFVVPALRSATQYRDVVDNLTAVVAWAQWHEPDQSTDVPLGVGRGELDAYITDPDFVRNARRTGAGIRVVDVRATNRGSSARTAQDAETTDSNVSPHIRRGHWRRQRFGHGLEQSKRIRIAPVLVNAHRGDIAHRVYRLRRSAKITMI